MSAPSDVEVQIEIEQAMGDLFGKLDRMGATPEQLTDLGEFDLSDQYQDWLAEDD